MHVLLSAALLLAATADAPAGVAPPEAEIVKGLKNLAQIVSVGEIIQLRRTAHVERPLDIPRDPWGTKYKIEGERIVSAGSDHEFELTELPNEQFAGLAGDIVYDEGRMFRSNRNWLYSHVQSGTEAAAALLQLRVVELQHMLLHLPEIQNLMLLRLTAIEMQRAGATMDGWGTPLRIEGKRVISAGADRQFDPDSWDKPATLDLNEDIIVEDGKVVRVVDPRLYLETNRPQGMPIRQPPDPPMPDNGTRVPVGGDVKAPVVIERVNPTYSEDYRRARISGIVIVQCAISAKGVVEDVRLLKSAAPDLDMAAMEAVRQWKFTPATRDGAPIPVLFNLTVNFKLK